MDIQRCDCEKERKVPPMETKFLLDQRSGRKMFICVEDKEFSQRLTNRLNRKRAAVQYAASTSASAQDTTQISETSSSSKNSTVSSDSSAGLQKPLQSHCKS